MAIGRIDPRTNPFAMTLRPCPAVDPLDETACLAILDTLDVLASPEMAQAITNTFDNSGRCTLAALLRGLAELPLNESLPLSDAVRTRFAALRAKAASLIEERE